MGFSGAKVVERLAGDLGRKFPDLKGLSPRNLLYMRAFAEAYPEAEFVQQLVAQLPWGHNVILLEKVKDPAARRWYAQSAREHGWSRSISTLQIDSNLMRHQGRAATNFHRTLPPPQSELAQQATRDPYIFDFLQLHDKAEGPAPNPEDCLRFSHLSRGKGGTLIAEGVFDGQEHRRRLCDPDGYRPQGCSRCGHGRLHVHDYRTRGPRDAGGEQLSVVRYLCPSAETTNTKRKSKAAWCWPR